MTTIQQDLTNATASIKANAEKFDSIINGDDTTVVSTDNGNVNSVAKAVKEIETEAETFRDEAQTAKTAAETAQAAAETAETNAETAETNAVAAKTAAETAQTAAETAETNAETAETNAVSAKTAAETAKTAAETAETNIDKKYLGSKSSAPTTDNDGGTLITGAQYFDTSSNAMKIWTGTAWATPVAISYNADDITTGKIDISLLDDGSITKAKIASGVVGLPTHMIATVNGIFFVRNTDGSLPTGITAANVWSLTDQSTALGGTAPSGKNHIELPAGKVIFKIAGAGGGGGAIGTGSDGGDTTLFGCTSKGGIYGQRASHVSIGRALAVGTIASGLNGIVKLSGGGEGGQAGGADNNGLGGDGLSGNLLIVVKEMTAGDTESFTLGIGGTGSIIGSGGDSNARASSGKNGFIEAEYIN